MKKVKKGMTLLEVVISLAIIAIMIIPLMNSLLTAVRANKKGEEVQDAKLLGQQFIEKLRLQDEVKEGTINFEGTTVTLGQFTEGTDLEAGYYDVTSTEVDGFTLEGRIYENKVREINSILEKNEYFNTPLAGLIVIKGDKMYLTKSLPKESVNNGIGEDGKPILVHKGTLKEIIKDNDKNNFVEKNITDDIEIKFTMPEGTKNYDIFIGNEKFVDNNGHALGIYIIDERLKK